MSLQQSFIAMLVPSADPGVSAGTIHLQSSGDLAGGQALNAEHDRLQSQGHAGRAIGLSGLAQRFEPLERA
jgi:hypothetical protein